MRGSSRKPRNPNQRTTSVQASKQQATCSGRSGEIAYESAGQHSYCTNPHDSCPHDATAQRATDRSFIVQPPTTSATHRASGTDHNASNRSLSAVAQPLSPRISSNLYHHHHHHVTCWQPLLYIASHLSTDAPITCYTCILTALAALHIRIAQYVESTASCLLRHPLTHPPPSPPPPLRLRPSPHVTHRQHPTAPLLSLIHHTRLRQRRHSPHMECRVRPERQQRRRD